MEHHQGWCGAFATGLRRHSWRVKIDTKPSPCDMIVFFGSRHAKLYKEQSGAPEVCLLERGYLGNRFEWTSVSLSGLLNGRAKFNNRGMPGDRWERHFSRLLRPWREKPDGYALIMHQLAGDMATMNVDLPRFYQKARRSFEPHMPVRERVHPHLLPRDGAERAAEVARSLESDLDGARVVVTHNSNSGVDAVLAGVPTIAMDVGSMAYEVSGHELGAIPPTPDRTQWAHNLAYCQWNRTEIENGEAWDHLKGAASC
jgi:hypothetical protein